MALKRCENGHYFDPGKHTSCPSCGVQNINFEPTKAKDAGAAAGGQANAGGGGSPVAVKTPPKAPQADARAAAADDGKTVALGVKKKGLDPVVGWLVCIAGPDRGRDYRIHSDNNFIGRGETMDISIRGDNTISRDKHAILSFNPRNQQFKLHANKDNRGLLFLNGDQVDDVQALKQGDRVELGETTLIFVPLVSDTFTWE
jgi:hypothetical protein